MADNLRTALGLLRREGPVAFLTASARRVSSAAADYARLRRAGRDLATRDLVNLVCRAETRPGSTVYAMQRASEVVEFLEMVRDRLPRTVLEIGTASGGMLFLLARCASPDATLISVDLPGGRHGGGYSSLRAPLYRSFATANQRIELIRADSHHPRTLERVRATLRGQPLDLLFVDGDHTREGVRRDVLMYGQLLGEHGILALHDICDDPAHPDVGVREVWELLARDRDSRQIIEQPTQAGYGIGVTTKRALQTIDSTA